MSSLCHIVLVFLGDFPDIVCSYLCTYISFMLSTQDDKLLILSGIFTTKYYVLFNID